MIAATLALMLAIMPADSLVPLHLGETEREWGLPPPVAPYGLSPLPSEPTFVKLVFPLIGPCRWIDGYGENRGQFLHTGIDIRAAKMTAIVAPISGTLGMKRMTFWIYGDNGWAILGTHLNDDNPGKKDHAGDRDVMFAPDLKPGCHVNAGRFLGYVGMSGDATAPHLHFELYVPGSGRFAERIRDPSASLKGATVLTSPVSALPDGAPTPRAGQVRVQGYMRKLDQTTGWTTVIATAKQLPNGKVFTYTSPRYLRVRLTAPEAEALGGWTALLQIPDTQGVAFYLRDGATLNGSEALSVQSTD